jgi:hypothetical protein
MARAVQKVALRCEQANENGGVLGKFIRSFKQILIRFLQSFQKNSKAFDLAVTELA